MPFAPAPAASGEPTPALEPGRGPDVGGEGAEQPASRVVDLADRLAAEASDAERLRLKHLAALIEKGALDRDIFEAVVHGRLYFLGDDPASASLLNDFRLRCKCDLRAFENAAELFEAVRSRPPAAVVVAGRYAGPGICTVLPELLVAAFGRDPVPVVVLSNRQSLLIRFEVLTYPALRFTPQEKGTEGLLTALERYVKVERATTLNADEAIKAEIGLSTAQAIQRKLLPETLPCVPGLEVAAYYKPCQEVSGDYYDFIPQLDGGLGVVCADVSGKGVGAAMVMVMFRSILRLAATRGSSPHEVMRVTNRVVSKDMLRGMFVTALYLCVDPKEGRVSLVNAGHLPPVHWPAAQSAPGEVPVRGMAVGLAPDKRFAEATHQGELRLKPGDLLCLCTDGVTEAENRRHEEFGVGRLLAAIQAAGRVPPQQTVDHVVAELAAFCGGAPQRDDTTLIVLKAPEKHLKITTGRRSVFGVEESRGWV